MWFAHNCRDRYSIDLFDRIFDFSRTDTVTGDIDDIISTSGDLDVAILIHHRTVTCKVDRLAIFFDISEVGFDKALRIAPDRTDHARPRACDTHQPFLPYRCRRTISFKDLTHDTRQRESRIARLDRCRTRQRRDHMSASLCLPVGIDDACFGAADYFIVPLPRRRVYRLSDGTEHSKCREVILLGLILTCFVQQPDRSGCSIELCDLMLLYHTPCTSGIRIGRYTLKHHRSRPCRKRSIDDIGMPGDPADIRRTPVDISLSDIKDPLHRHLCPEDVARL